MLIAVVRHPNGPRLYVGGQRVHHGASGSIALVAAVVRKWPRVARLCALAAVAHDLHDWRIWFVRESYPITTREA